MAAEWKSNNLQLITNVINNFFIKFVCNYNIILTSLQDFYSVLVKFCVESFCLLLNTSTRRTFLMRKKRYTPEDCLRFYQMPQIFYNKNSKYFELMKNGVARELYMLLKDRNELSIQNNWIDEEGYIYFYFKQEELSEVLRVSAPTLRKAFNELKRADLVEVVRQGMNLPNKLYLLQPENDIEPQVQLGLGDVIHKDRKNFSFRTERIFPSGQKEFFP